METDFKVRVGEFEGPLELLLDLIERSKLHISEVSLASVADSFIEHIKAHEEFRIADSADFLLIASTLLLIKSRSLLPNLELSKEEEENIDTLEDRLKEYQRYKELASGIQKMFGNFLFFAQESKGLRVVFTPTNEVNLENLHKTLYLVLQNLPKEAAIPKVVVEKVISLEEMISNLADRIQKSFRMSFSSFAKASTDKKDFGQASKGDKINVIVSFLAMLELVKRGAVRVSQGKHFDDIEIESEDIITPQY